YNMNEKERVLIDNFNEYYQLGLMAFKTARYNSATTLFFKAVAALCDLYILRQEGQIPSSHTQRFRILEEKYAEIYKIVDRDFPFYQNSYTNKMDKEAALLLKEDAESIKKKLDI
ncbi:hypothetical protein J4409_03270, partial [Candidatus Woesearchaeota archaeon]|nr:hypothetical protein [Candidatus Woesearchaeota archaeon]